MGDELGVERKAILILSLACTYTGVRSSKRECGGVSGMGDGKRDVSMSSRMSRGESSSRELEEAGMGGKSKEAGMGGKSKAGDGSGVGEKLSVVDGGDGCSEDSSEKGGGMVDKMSGKWIAWMVGLESKSNMDVKSA